MVSFLCQIFGKKHALTCLLLMITILDKHYIQPKYIPLIVQWQYHHDVLENGGEFNSTTLL